MSKYKSFQISDQDPDHVFDCGSSNIEYFSDGKPIESDIPSFYYIMEKECIYFVESFQNSNIDLSIQIIKNILRSFLDNHNNFDSDKIDISLLIQIFENSQFFSLISHSIHFFANIPELFNNIMIFVYEFTRCNGLFCSYLANNFFVDFISSLELVLGSDVYKINVSIIIIILSNLFENIDPQSFDSRVIIQKIYSFVDSFYSYEQFLQQQLDYQKQQQQNNEQLQHYQLQLQNQQHKIIIFLSNVIKKLDLDADLYKFFIQFIVDNDCVNLDTFSLSITTLNYMIKKANDNYFIIYVLQSGIFEKFSDTYFANEYSLIQEVFPIYMKTITNLLRFFDSNNLIKTQQPELWKELISMRSDLLKTFPRQLLYLILEEIDDKENISCHTVIDFISVLSQQGCLMEVFADKKRLIYLIFEVYEFIDSKGKEKMLELFLSMINSSKFFKRQLFNSDFINFSESFSDFIENECEKSIYIITEIIDLALKKYYKKGQEFIFLTNLVTSEDFMASLSRGSEEITNEDLRIRMQDTFTKLDEISSKFS